MNTALWIVVSYLAIGCLVMAATYEREQDGWLWAIILWPLQLLAHLGGKI